MTRRPPGILLAVRATTSDGRPLELRPIGPGDGALLADHFARLGPESRYRRFLGPHPTLSEREVRFFTHLDHVLHEGLFAIDPETGHVVGVARYIADASEPTTGELAIAVIDAWQGCGVGRILTRALADHARHEGVVRWTASVLAENRPMLRLLDEVGEVRRMDADGGVLDLMVVLGDPSG